MKSKTAVMRAETKKWGWKVKIDKKTEEAEKKYAKLAKETVGKLDVLAERNINSWVEMGRLVSEFVKITTNNGTRYVDAHKILERSSGSTHTADMLRKYEQGYKLWVEVKEKGRPPAVSMSHFLSVLYCKANLDEKIALLTESEKEKSSVSQLKKKVAERFPSKKVSQKVREQDSAIIFDYEKCVKVLSSSVCQSFSQLSAFNREKGNKTLPANIKENLISFIDFVINNKFVSLSELNACTTNTSNITTVIEQRKAA